MKHRNLTIIGTSHIAQQSLDEVKKAIEKDKPDIVALELDKNRLYALMHKKKGKISIYNIRKIGFKGFLFYLIGAWAEKKLGEYVGVSPGSEMKKAVKLARKNNAKIIVVPNPQASVRVIIYLFWGEDKKETKIYFLT